MECPTHFFAGSAQGQHDAAENEAADNDTDRVGNRIAAGFAFIAAHFGKAQRLQPQYGKDAGHEIEQQATEHGECQYPPKAKRGLFLIGRRTFAQNRYRIAARWHRARNSAHLKPLRVIETQ